METAMLQNQRDPEATLAAHFSSKKSYRSFAGHWYVYGERDHAWMRTMIYNQAKGMCQLCEIPHFVSWREGQWSHPQAFGGKRCDGPCCGKWCCHDAHIREHHGRTF